MMNLLRVEVRDLGSRQEERAGTQAEVTCRTEVFPATHHSPDLLLTEAMGLPGAQLLPGLVFSIFFGRKPGYAEI